MGNSNAVPELPMFPDTLSADSIGPGKDSQDFTYAKYEQFVETVVAAEYTPLTVREVLAERSRPDRFAVLRHDVDRKPENALDLARIEAEHDVPATYYFRTVDRTFDPDLIKTISSLGHEIGYHYEDLDRADGEIQRAHEQFAQNLGKLRAIADVDTVCMHGNPLTPHDNRDMWTEPYDFGAYDLLGEAYLSVDFTDLTYFTDTGRTWRDGTLKIKDTPVGPAEKQLRAATTDDLIELLSSKSVERPYLLSHPNRWAGTGSEFAYLTVKDAAINVGKRTMQVFR